MVRAPLLAATAVLTMGAARPPSVDYRVGVEPAVGHAPVLDIEIRLRGDADGETRLRLPEGVTGAPRVDGARTQAAEPDGLVLRHRAGARLTIRYQARPAGGDAAGLGTIGDAVLAVPEGRPAQAVTFRWGRLPEGWKGATDLEHGAAGRPMTVADVRPSVLIAGTRLQVVTRSLPGGVIRAAMLGDVAAAERLAGAAASAIAAVDGFWGDTPGPYLLVAGPFLGAPRDLGDGMAIAAGALSNPDLPADIARARMGAWLPSRLGQPGTGPAPAWLTGGLGDLYASRLLLRAGQIAPEALAADLDAADHSRDASRRGVILALKWDEDIRRKTSGKVNLDDVLLRMRDHYRRFPGGQGPDIVTGLVSAAWVLAQIDLRPDIARYAEGGTPIPLPETLFDGCLDARVTIAPGFDAGFDPAGSFASRVVRGVRRGGPAWNSGLRNGMTLQSWRFAAGDMSREIELHVRPTGKRSREKTIRYWPYGDADVETRRLALSVGLSDAAQAICARRLGGMGA